MSLLIQNVTLQPSTFGAFTLFTITDLKRSGSIRSLLIEAPSEEAEAQVELFGVDHELLDTLSPDDQWTYRCNHWNMTKRMFFEELDNLETLVIQSPFYMMFPFLNISDTIPHKFFTLSLKRLHVYSTEREKGYGISCKEALWLLCFCPLLHQAILHFSMTLEETKF